MQEAIYINEIALTSVGRWATFRLTDAAHTPLPPLNRYLRREAGNLARAYSEAPHMAERFFFWECSACLQEYAGGATMHPGDWQHANACWTDHPPLGFVLAQAGYDGGDWNIDALRFHGEPEPVQVAA